MSQEKTTLEVIAPTVDEAVQKGMAQLGVSVETVDVEVLDQGSKGLFGLGSRQARVRLTMKADVAPKPLKQPSTDGGAAVQKEAPAAAVSMPGAPVDVDDEADDLEAEESQVALDVSQQVVSELLEQMRVQATVTTSYREPEDDEDESVIQIAVEGDDLSILLGKRYETLNAFQYIASLIICKRLNRWTPIMVDVQGYRARRERQLRQIARRFAEQAIQTGRRQILEPMPANERRLIHLELRNHPQVITESTGEEPNRKVTISVKQ